MGKDRVGITLLLINSLFYFLLYIYFFLYNICLVRSNKILLPPYFIPYIYLVSHTGTIIILDPFNHKKTSAKQTDNVFLFLGNSYKVLAVGFKVLFILLFCPVE